MIENCLIAMGTSYSGAGINLYSGATATVTNCTIVANTSNQGSGITSVWGSMVTLRNSIVWGNSSPSFQTYFAASNGAINAEHCLLEAIATSESACLHTDPLFYAGSLDFGLSSTSPCIDSGDTALSTTASDLGGEPRVFGVSIDIGCDEFNGLFGPMPEGNVGASSGGPYDVLFVNGSSGGSPRRVDVQLSSPVTISVAQPPTNILPALFAIVGFIGIPTPADVTPLPFNVGTLCFPSYHLNPGQPGLFVLTNNYGPDAFALVPSTPAPWSLTVNGLPFPFQFTLQGVINQDPVTVRVTNGVLVNVQ